ncbi:MAG: TIGR01212 family radical SAM protein [Lachnospiraceae bacterium]|nr:TIGR01212 family radical SAM protein [Lachnospiraceae bacterium]
MEKIPYYSLNQYLKKKFGCKVLKVSLDAGCTCPNRDGKLDTRGCIFCSKGGSGDFAGDRRLSIKEQLRLGKEFIKAKNPKHEEVKYIAYFQAFTNTYGPIDKLRNKFLDAINDPEVCVLSIATRPDCLQKEVLSLLDDLNKIKPVWVELGLQTIKPESIEYIRRGYPNEVYDKAVNDLTDLGIEVITHVILGLPNETKEDMINTVKYVGASGSKGIKLQLLHVLKETDLYDDYKNGFFETLSMDEYIDIVVDAIKALPKDMVIHRLTGDGDKKILVSPMWSANKKAVLNVLSRRLIQRGTED